MNGEIPDDPDERIDWILDRARMLDVIRRAGWIADEIEKHWENPDQFADDGLYEVPERADKQDYALFKLGLLFGTEYEHQFPRDDGGRDE